MVIETKEVLLQDLIDMIEILNSNKYWMQLRPSMKFQEQVSKRCGSKVILSILKKYKQEDLHCLTCEQIEESISMIYKVVIFLSSKEYNAQKRNNDFFRKCAKRFSK